MKLPLTWTLDISSQAHVLLWIACVALSGCITRGNSEVLEAQLRRQESVIQQFQSQVSSLKSELVTAERESDLLRKELADTANKQLHQEATRALAKVEGIEFHSLLTAGQDLDDTEGDEQIHTLFYPHDSTGELVKLSGDIEIEAVDLGRPSEDRTIGRWSYTSDEARKHWHAGFLASGYQFDLPWERTPQGKEVLLLAKLKTPDGREFQASHKVKVNVSPLASSDGADPKLIAPPAPDLTKADNTKADNEQTPKTVTVPNPYEFQAPTKTAQAKQQRPMPLDSGVLQVGYEKLHQEKGKADAQPAKVALPESLDKPRPFPAEPVITSDSWKDSEIPVLR